MAINWHSAFFDALRAELIHYLPVLDFVQEHYLNTEPLRTDALIIKKAPHAVINKNFAEDFKGHNLFEFKSPSDSLSVSDYIKVIGYACIYQSAANIPYTDVTITLVCTKHPREVMKHLRAVQYKVTEKYPGIYVVEGERFPTRVLESKRLLREENIWLQSLRKGLNISELNEISELSLEIQQGINLSAYLDVLLNANKNLLRKGDSHMTKSTENLLKEIGWVDKWRTEGIAEGRTEGIDNTLYIIKGLKNNISPKRLAEETDMPIEQIEKIQEAVFY